ncbi:hypothetical protein [Pandoraea norimbergensis]|uniref:hypothetical protein n=1 Tax=Pandoraea norimbergensis TaxID=93219 RepID=UPI000A4C5869|nr:hypothetical protein [Pandoraea norimbergensis]
MGASLTVVPTTLPQVKESVCRVFNPGLTDRLGVANCAARALRDMGYRVIDQVLYPERGDKPELRIVRDRQTSISPLLDAAGERRWRNEGGVRRGYAVFHGVTVSWEDA